MHAATTQLFAFEPVRPMGNWLNRLFHSQMLDCRSLCKKNFCEPIRPMPFFERPRAYSADARAYSADARAYSADAREPIRPVPRAYVKSCKNRENLDSEHRSYQQKQRFSFKKLQNN